MRVMAIFGDAPNQIALAQKLSAVHPIDRIVLVKPNATRRRKAIGEAAVAASVGLPFRFAWSKLQSRYRQGYRLPLVPTLRAESANDPSVLAEIRQYKPDLVLVSGTDLLRAPVINEISLNGRTINLHTGISPYIRGGPNCTNWALFCGRPDLIGSTIMWLDPGIDTGNIVTTERVPAPDLRNLSRLHLQVMEHAHDLYCRAYGEVVSGRPVPNVPQSSLGTGRLFLGRQWNGRTMYRALLNYYVFNSRASGAAGWDIEPEEVKLVPLKRG